MGVFAYWGIGVCARFWGDFLAFQQIGIDTVNRRTKAILIIILLTLCLLIVWLAPIVKAKFEYIDSIN